MSKLIPYLLVIVLLVPILVAACPSGQDSESELVTITPTQSPFDFATTSSVEIDLLVTLDGEAASGVLIQLLESASRLSEGEPKRELDDRPLFEGLTDGDGRLRGRIRIPTRVREFELRATALAASGPYHNERLRAQWGHFSSTALLRMSREQLTSAVVPLASRPADYSLDAHGFPRYPLESIGRLLAEANANATRPFIASPELEDWSFTRPGGLAVIFVHDGSPARDSLGWFSYSREPGGEIRIKDRGLLYSDVSQAPDGPLTPGDLTVVLDAVGSPKRFERGDRIGFWILRDGHRDVPEILNWHLEPPAWPSEDPSRHRNLGRHGLFTTVSSLNPEHPWAPPELGLDRHAAFFWHPGLPGFLQGQGFAAIGMEAHPRTQPEDWMRGDFNDVVFVMLPTDGARLEVPPRAVVDELDVDGDGVIGLLDEFPADPDRAWTQHTPAGGFTLWALEDSYPRKGDQDFNDAVVAVHESTVFDSQRNMREYQAVGHLLARGSNQDHAFGLHLPWLSASVRGRWILERQIGMNDLQIVEGRLEEWTGAQAGRIRDLIPSTQAAFAQAPNTPVNTLHGSPPLPVASFRLRIEFDAAIGEDWLWVQAARENETPYRPFEFFFDILRDGQAWDVHLPGYLAFGDRQEGLPDELDQPRFRARDGSPFLLEIPAVWRYPSEGVAVWDAYPDFEHWQTAAGTTSTDWYLHPTRRNTLIGPDWVQQLPQRRWTPSIPND